MYIPAVLAACKQVKLGGPPLYELFGYLVEGKC